VHAGLRAAIQGVSFLPMAGLTGSDLLRNFKAVADPYTGQTWAAIPAIRPDWTIVHAHEADEAGNVRIYGAKYDDILKAKAAAHVLVTCERLITVQETSRHPERTVLPGFLVDAVAVVPRGAWPQGCEGEYGYDEAFFRAYLAAAAGPDEGYSAFLEEVLAR
jgi:glutaconate CoA-transferase, subunit A